MKKTIQEPSEKRSLYHALCGLCLTLLMTFSIQFWWMDGSLAKGYIFLAAALGFIMGYLYGKPAIDFLKEIFWWA
jgi:hypothetical protein